MHRSACRLLTGFLLMTACFAQRSQAQTPWVGTWAAAPSADPVASGALTEQTTLREIVHVSRGGSEVRVTLTNELGRDPLTISGAHLGLHSNGSTLVPGSDKVLTFGGQPTIVIPPGAVAVSDALSLNLASASDVAVTLLLPAQPMHIMTAHDLAVSTNYQVDGDQLGSPSLQDAKAIGRWPLLKNVEVNGPGAAVVTLGDSITDGFRSTIDTNRRWPDVLAARLQAEKKLNGLGVLNAGISGNRVLHDGAGPNALARFDRDVLGQSGVRYLIVLEAINDIGRTGQPHEPTDPITAQQLIVGYEQLIDRAHDHGIKVFGATLTPFLGAGYATPAGEQMRQTVNQWIRTSGRFDAVLDFDKVTRDPANLGAMLPAADCGDHLHPSDAGYKMMGDSIDLKLFKQ